MEDNRTPRLLISFVLDNSCTVRADRLQALGEAFAKFGEAVAENTDLEWELMTFGGLQPVITKSFEDKALKAITPNGFPLLGRTVGAAADRLLARAAELKAAGHAVHRPWLLLLSDGFSSDSLEEIALRLDGLERGGEIMCLPFKLSPKLTTDRMQYLDRNKHMIEIKQGGLDGFFAFMLRMIGQRESLAADMGIKFAKTDFEGWAEL
ncbi:MAG: hypothetical protein IJY22_06065 [Clostridia bacterium]|nr:hypothetical protein [Clostridia bacterium]